LAVNEDEPLMLPHTWLSDVDADVSVAQNFNGDPEAPSNDTSRSNDPHTLLTMVDFHLSCHHGTLTLVHVEQNSNIPTPTDGVHVEVTANINHANHDDNDDDEDNNNKA
jgi:hypothetical protein